MYANGSRRALPLTLTPTLRQRLRGRQKLRPKAAKSSSNLPLLPPCRGHPPTPSKNGKICFYFFPPYPLSPPPPLVSRQCGAATCVSRRGVGEGGRYAHTKALSNVCVCLAVCVFPLPSSTRLAAALLGFATPLTTAASFRPAPPLLPCSVSLCRVYHTSFAIFHFNFH